MLKKDDIFIGWSLWSVAGHIVLSILWFECGLSSNQISTNDARNVVLFVVDTSSIHHYIFGLTNAITCSLNYGIPFKRKPRWIVVEPIDNILISSMILLDNKLVLETFVSIIFVIHSWSICLDQRSDFLQFMCIWSKLPPWIRESQCCLLWNHLKSVMHVRSMLWFDRLATSILYVSLACQATDWFVQGERVPS